MSYLEEKISVQKIVPHFKFNGIPTNIKRRKMAIINSVSVPKFLSKNCDNRINSSSYNLFFGSNTFNNKGNKDKIIKKIDSAINIKRLEETKFGKSMDRGATKEI